MRVTTARLLSPDRTAVRLDAAALLAAVGGPMEVSERFREAPRAVLPLMSTQLESFAQFSLGAVLHAEFDDDTLEAWRVVRRTGDYTGGDAECEFQPLWMDLGRRALVVDITTEAGEVAVRTPRLALLHRPPGDALGVAFDPANGAPRLPGGSAQFVVGTIDPALADARVDVSLVAPTPLDVLTAVADELRCLWRARLVRSGADASEEVYEVDLYTPTRPDLAAGASTGLAAANTSRNLLPVVGNAGVSNVQRLEVDDDDRELYTSLVPFAGSGDALVGVDRAVWQADPGTGAEAGERALRLVDPSAPSARASVAVPYDGALVGLALHQLGTENYDTVTRSLAPDLIYTAATSRTGYLARFTDADGLPLVRLVHRTREAEYGLIERVTTYDEIHPYPNLTQDPTMSLAAPATTGTATWTDEERDVSVGDRSVLLTLDAGETAAVGIGPELFTRDLWRAEVAVRVSLRVHTGSIMVGVYSGGSMTAVQGADGDALLLTVEPAETLTDLDFAAAEGTFDESVALQVRVTAGVAGAVLAWDSAVAVPSTTPTGYVPKMGPGALWTRAWEDLALSGDRVTTATTDLLDLSPLGVAGTPIEVGDWVVCAPGGRETFPAQVLDTERQIDLSGGVSVEVSARLGPPPPDLAARLSDAPPPVRSAFGSKRAPVLLALVDTDGGADGQSVEPSDPSAIEERAETLSFLGTTYEVTVLRVTTPSLLRRSDSESLPALRISQD